MRYLILRPVSPADPRHLAIDGIPHLHELFPLTVECESEEEAVETVRSMYPDAVAMPIPLKIGSGEMFILGIVADVTDAPVPARWSDPTDVVIPFVLLIQAVAEDSRERKDIRDRAHFSAHRWKAPVREPTDNVVEYTVELRATDLANPVVTTARVGEHDGRLTIYCVIGGIEMSMKFTEATARLDSSCFSSHRLK